MPIPTQFRGLWQGMVIDFGRVKPYPGEIILDADRVATIYHMARGSKKGILTMPREQDGGLVLNEKVGSWSGTLTLRLNDGCLVCEWHGSGRDSEGIFTRVKSDDSKSD